MQEQERERRSIDTIRALAMDAVEQANAGHPGTAMALAPLAYVLFERELKLDPADPEWPNRDRFVLSAGHACVLQYALLHLTGFDLALEDLKQFRQWGSRTPGHPERSHTPGIEVTTGPLGQGVGNAVGMALAERFLAERFGQPGLDVVDHRTYAICSDGDLMEGVCQEAASVAGHFGLGKLTVCYDENHITIDGTTALSFDGEDHVARFAAYGWHVQRVEDSEDLAEIEAALAAARAEPERPSFIAVRSHIAYPAPNATDTAKAHGAPLGEKEVRATKVVMGMDPDRSFVVEPEVYEHMNLRERGAAVKREWQQRFEQWRQQQPELAADWDRAWAGRLREGWKERLPRFEPGTKLATRAAGQKTMAAFAEFAPTMIGGAADLVESTKTLFEGGGEFSRVHAGRNVPFGIREHAMGAIVNGAAAHGGIVKPYGSTFLIFSDYMRPSVRLSALMGLPVVWVWTHDSVGLGEDGPTHQPIEHCAALRAIPDLWVIRPADANETAWAWEAALEREDGPVALLLSRQNLPVLQQVIDASDGASTSPAGPAAGAYVLWDSQEGGQAPELVLIATGSEVAPTLQAGEQLAERGLAVRVVSMPCMELFEAQSEDYRQSVIPSGVRARLAVEAAASMSWWKWVGEHGEVLGIDRFGASAPGPTVLEKLGFTPDAIAERAAALHGRVGAGAS
ncbi:MAG TPA: transketolase [Solirubrobacteraceae bacterium]|jgi:transketolase